MTETSRGMKAKTIKSILRRKVDAWINSIEDEELQKWVREDTIVTGGAIPSMLLGEPVNDFDIYFRTFETTKRVAEYYLARFTPGKKRGINVPLSLVVDGERGNRRVRIVAKSAGIASEEGTEKPYEYFEHSDDERASKYVSEIINDPATIEDVYEETEKKALATKTEEGKKKYRPLFMTSNAITLADKIQIVIRFYGPPNDIHKNYDFVHCTCYWTSHDDALVLRPAALEALLSRTLVYVGSKYPVCSLVRVRKFVSHGWQINAGQLLKMAMQISALDLTDLRVLEDQLTGVDTAYFLELIEKLKEKDGEKVDSAYLVEIVDKIF